MSFIISDGTGTGKSAKVDEENRLTCRVDSRSQIAFISQEKEQAYVISTGELAVDTTGGQMLWMLNSSQTKHIHLSQIWVSWNGGNTTKNTIVRAALWGATTAPTANNTANPGSNLNTGSGNNADITAYSWNGVGSAMTGSTGGGAVGYAFCGNGVTNIQVNDSMIIQFNDSIAFNLIGEETGLASILASFYFVEG